MKSALIAAIALVTTGMANASCYGSSTNYTCNDASGNSYNVQKYGNSTNIQGYSAGTGSSWSQSSQTYGNTTQTYGNANGRSWNEMTPTSPGMTNYSGTNSRGQSFNRTCTAYGCN